MAHYILAVDAGSTGIRATIYDQHCREVCKSYEKLSTKVACDGVFETDAEVVFETVVLSIRNVISKSGIGADKITCMGITNQRSTFTSWNRQTGENLHPFISWADLRGSEVCDTANSSPFTYLLRYTCTLLYWITRMPLFLTVSHLTLKNNQLGPKLCWVLKYIPEVKKCLDDGNLCVGTLDSWLLYRLSGRKMHATDSSNASATGVFDPYSLSWSGIVKFMVYPYKYVPTNVYPQVKCTSDDFGKTEKSLFGHEIPIKALAGDQQAALFGQGCINYGDTKVTLGTGGFVNCNTGNKAAASYGTLYPLVAWNINKNTIKGNQHSEKEQSSKSQQNTIQKINTTFAMEGPDTTAGLGVEWLTRVGLITDPNDSETVAMSVPDSGGVFYVPALYGLGAPHWDDHARAMFIGMTASTSKAHLVRAALECYGFRVAEILESFYEDVLSRSKHSGLLHISGGMSKNNFVCQTIADITGLTVVRPTNIETTSIGIAFLAGLQCGIWKSEEEIHDIQKVERKFVPAIDQRERNKRIAEWNKAVERASKFAEPKINQSKTSKLIGITKFIIILSAIIGLVAWGVMIQPWFEIRWKSS